MVYHMCSPIPNTKRYRDLVRETVLINSGLDACANQQAEVVEAFAAGDIWEAWRRAMQLSYGNLICEKASFVPESNPDKHSLEAIGILKRATDMEDKYLIYKINDSA